MYYSVHSTNYKHTLFAGMWEWKKNPIICLFCNFRSEYIVSIDLCEKCKLIIKANVVHDTTRVAVILFHRIEPILIWYERSAPHQVFVQNIFSMWAKYCCCCCCTIIIPISFARFSTHTKKKFSSGSVCFHSRLCHYVMFLLIVYFLFTFSTQEALDACMHRFPSSQSLCVCVFGFIACANNEENAFTLLYMFNSQHSPCTQKENSSTR